MEYKTYWTILETPSNSIKSKTVCLVFAILAGFLWILIKKYHKSKATEDQKIILWGTGTFAIIGLTFYFLLTFFYLDNSESEILKMLDSPTTPKVEGLVSNFKREFRKTKYILQTTEKFTVENVHFEYNDVPIVRFNSFSKTYNNVIKNGQRIRVTYRKDTFNDENFNFILRIELWK
jgi:hypothetical protein